MEDHPSLPAAVFVDFENVYNAIKERRGTVGGDLTDLSIRVLVQLRDELGKKHALRLLLGRAYADWTWLGEAMSSLALLSIQPIYVLAKPGKNSADLELSLDMQEALLTREDVEHYVLVGGDRDYIPIVRRLLEKDKRVLVAAFNSAMSGDLRTIVGNQMFIALDSFLPAPTTIPAPPGPPAETVSAPAAPRQSEEVQRVAEWTPPETQENEAWAIPIPAGFIPKEEDLLRALDLVIDATVGSGREEIPLVSFFKSHMNAAFLTLSAEQRKALVATLRTRGAIRLVMRAGPYGAVDNYSGNYVTVVLIREHPTVAVRIPDSKQVRPAPPAPAASP